MEDYLAIVNGRTETALGHAYSKKKQVEEEAKTSRSPPSVLDATQIGGRIGMNHHKKLINSPSFTGWYADISLTWPREGNSNEAEKVLFHGKFQYQELLIFQSEKHGKIAILDGFLQLTEKEEFAYQEMLTNLPLCSIPNPKKVLLMGGGDEGILWEISRRSSVEQVDICEINAMVVNAYKQFFPDIAVGYKDPRVRLHVGDGVAFMRSIEEGTYDVIISYAFPRIIGVSTIGQFKVEETIAKCHQVFKGSVNYACSTVPAYSRGMIGFMLYATEGPAINFKNPINPLDVDDYGVTKGLVRFTLLHFGFHHLQGREPLPNPDIHLAMNLK